MNPYQQAVREFMVAMKQSAPPRPTLDGYPLELRTKLILEEALEFAEAANVWVVADEEGDLHYNPPLISLVAENGTGLLECNDAPPDWPKMVDALCDLLYVTFGAAVAMGIDLDGFFDLVHKANMAKAGGPIREDGKIMKPANWVAPDIAGLLRTQTEDQGPHGQ